jgi:hypothetical protein
VSGRDARLVSNFVVVTVGLVGYDGFRPGHITPEFGNAEEMTYARVTFDS